MNFSERFNQTKKCCVFNRLLLLRERIMKVSFQLCGAWTSLTAGPFWSWSCSCCCSSPSAPPTTSTSWWRCSVWSTGWGRTLCTGACSTSSWTPRCCLTIWWTFTATRAALSAAYPRCRNRNIAGTRGISSRERRSGGTGYRRSDREDLVPGARQPMVPHPQIQQKPFIPTGAKPTRPSSDHLLHFIKRTEKLENKELSLPFFITIAAFLLNKLLASCPSYQKSCFKVIFITIQNKPPVTFTWSGEV